MFNSNHKPVSRPDYSDLYLSFSRELLDLKHDFDLLIDYLDLEYFKISKTEQIGTHVEFTTSSGYRPKLQKRGRPRKSKK